MCKRNNVGTDAFHQDPVKKRCNLSLRATKRWLALLHEKFRSNWIQTASKVLTTQCRHPIEASMLLLAGRAQAQKNPCNRHAEQVPLYGYGRVESNGDEGSIAECSG